MIGIVRLGNCHAHNQHSTSIAHICTIQQFQTLNRAGLKCSSAARSVISLLPGCLCSDVGIGLYRDVWIAAIASSRTSLATLMGVMCNTSQCELRSLRVNSGMLNVIRIVTYYTLPLLESPDSFWIAMAFSR